MILSICAVFFIIVALLIWNPTSRRIRRINSILNKDRSVCDFINDLDGWRIEPKANDPAHGDGLRVIITPMGLPMYELYITYHGERPTNDQIKELYTKMTDENSPVMIAHSMGMPFDQFDSSLENKDKQKAFANKSIAKSDIKAAVTLGIPVMRFMHYQTLYNEYQDFMREHGANSQASEKKFAEIFKQIDNPNEWRRYQDYRYGLFQQQIAEDTRSMLGFNNNAKNNRIKRIIKRTIYISILCIIGLIIWFLLSFALAALIPNTINVPLGYLVGSWMGRLYVLMGAVGLTLFCRASIFKLIYREPKHFSLGTPIALTIISILWGAAVIMTQISGEQAAQEILENVARQKESQTSINDSPEPSVYDSPETTVYVTMDENFNSTFHYSKKCDKIIESELYQTITAKIAKESGFTECSSCKEKTHP